MEKREAKRRRRLKKSGIPWPVLWAALCLAGCAGLAPEKAGIPPETPPPERPRITADTALSERREPAPPRRALPENLPPEARAYLENLSRAFRTRDREFLLNQGEAQFEAEVRPFYDEDVYLALLYRVGPYAQDRPRQDLNFPRLFPEEVDGIEYADWEERGPYLEIRGRLVRRGKEPLPCCIVLIWKLREPKIQGRFP
jgi:hypothetical protein